MTNITTCTAEARGTANKSGTNDLMEGVTNLLSYFEDMVIDEWTELREDVFGCNTEEEKFREPESRINHGMGAAALFDATNEDDDLASTVSTITAPSMSVPDDGNYPQIEAVFDSANEGEGTVSMISATSSQSYSSLSGDSSESSSQCSNLPIPTAIYFRRKKIRGRRSSLKKKVIGGFQSFSKRLRHKRILPTTKWSKRNGYKSRNWMNKFSRRRKRAARMRNEEEVIVFDADE